MAMYAAGGAFGGTLLAMLLLWLLTGGFCCDKNRVSMQKPATTSGMETYAVEALRYS